MKEQVIELCNAILWDRYNDEKVDMNQLRIAFADTKFATRQVCLRFADGPDLDLAFFDMDRIAVAYLEMRGVVRPSEVKGLTNAARPPRCDFLVPKDIAPMLIGDCSPRTVDEKHCVRCLQTKQYSGDWYGDLCPECADETEPDA